MHISKFTLRNYKSFHEPSTLILDPGFNIITGPNNAGKTSLLNGLTLNFLGNPHRSEKTIPTVGAPVDPVSWANVSITMTTHEVLTILQRFNGPVWIARPSMGSEFANSIGWRTASQEETQILLDRIFANETLTFDLRYQAGRGQPGDLIALKASTFGIYEAECQGSETAFMNFQVTPTLSYSPSGGSVSGSLQLDFGLPVANYFQSQIYRFSAERFSIGSSPHGNNPVLRSDAGNLPEVLAILQANTSRFENFNRLLRSILPQVHHVSVRPDPRNPQNVEIIVWTTRKETERIDLALPLSDCGSGVGQVLAILYVMLHPETARLMIIDEPQSFLHPGAARKLIEILKIHFNQQIILATHSATVISAAEPRTVTVARYENGITDLEQLNARESKTLQTCLAQTGARLADVFGADDVMWVEGPTEFLAFPLILSQVAKKPLMGTAILSVRNVGDLQGRDARKVLEIYRNLAKGHTLMPPTVGFVFDTECLTTDEQRELKRLGDGLVHFLPRRMYENYLLDPDAIAAVANSISNFRENAVTAEEVQALLDMKNSDATNFCGRQIPHNPANRIREIDGGKVLKEIFSTLSGTRVSYDKIRHSTALTEQIIEHKSTWLKELADWLTDILGEDCGGFDRRGPDRGLSCSVT